MSRELLECARHEALARFLHARCESFDLELASFDKVVDIEPSRCRILNRYVRLPALGCVSSIALRSGLALLAGDIALCRHSGQRSQAPLHLVVQMSGRGKELRAQSR